MRLTRPEGRERPGASLRFQVPDAGLGPGAHLSRSQRFYLAPRSRGLVTLAAGGSGRPRSPCRSSSSTASHRRRRPSAKSEPPCSPQREPFPMQRSHGHHEDDRRPSRSRARSRDRNQEAARAAQSSRAPAGIPACRRLFHPAPGNSWCESTSRIRRSYWEHLDRAPPL